VNSETTTLSKFVPFAVAMKPFLKLDRSKLLRQFGWTAVAIAGLLLATTILLTAFHYPAATVFAIVAGVATRCIGQRRVVEKVATPERAATLASFQYDGNKVRCSWDDRRLSQYISPLRLRIWAASAAAGACFLGQRLLPVKFQMPPLTIMNSHWLFTANDAPFPLLLVASALLFLWWRGPEQRWSEQVKRAVERRAELAIGRVLAPGQIDGLQAGVEILWKWIGVDRRGEYRRAISRHIEANTTQVVFKPQSSQSVVNAIFELARQDLEHLSASTVRYNEVECAWKALQTVASEFRDPVRELRAQELKVELEQLSRLASDRRWSDLASHADWMLGELHRLHLELRSHANSVPRVALPAGSDPYRILGIGTDTPTALIKKLRIRLAQIYHPDVSESVATCTKMAELNAAYDAVMKDREKERR